VRFGPDPVLAEWVEAARPVAMGIAGDPEMQARWLRCGGTWFAGVNVLPNDADGAVEEAGVPALSGAAVDFVRDALGLAPEAWDRAQVSVCHPGYPRPWEGESEAAFGYRLRRDAAHVDGLLRDDARRRCIGETHAFLLGLPLTEAHPDAAPFVVWEGSHEIMRRALRERLAGVPAGHWSEADVTDAYWAARREAFETCPRVAIRARPGEAYVCHRLLLHGVAPWTAPEGPPRAIAYFRPERGAAPDPRWWLEAP